MIKTLFIMAGTLLLMGCSASKGPNLHYDRYKTPSDLFRELGLMRSASGGGEYVGKNIRAFDDDFKGFCASQNGVWSSSEKVVAVPIMWYSGFLRPGASKNSTVKVSFGKCTVEGEPYFDYKETWGDSRSYAIDRVAEKEYLNKAKERRQPW